MSQARIYHNPRCSKSRAALALLEENNVEVQVVKYLETPPSAEELATIIELLNCSIRDILRTKEAEYKAHRFDDAQLSEAEVIQLVTQYPKVLERPIVIHNGQAVIGRPPENVLEII